MKIILRFTLGCLLSGMSLVALTAEPDRYRIAGIIASGVTGWRAIVELPDGEQRLVNVGDKIGEVEVVLISKTGVTLQFPGGERQMQLTQGDYLPLPEDTLAEAGPASRHTLEPGAGVLASDFSKLLEKRLDPQLREAVYGLEILDRLAVNSRIIGYSYLGDPDREPASFDSAQAGIDILQQAIVSGKEIRISVEGDESFPNFYIMPRRSE